MILVDSEPEFPSIVYKISPRGWGWAWVVRGRANGVRIASGDASTHEEAMEQVRLWAKHVSASPELDSARPPRWYSQFWAQLWTWLRPVG
jgi:hypothetical protein